MNIATPFRTETAGLLLAESATRARSGVRLGLIGLFLGAFAVGADAFMISGLLPRIGADVHASTSTVAQLVTVFAFGYAVGAPVLASVFSRVGRRTLLVVALTALALANAAAAVAPNLGVLFLARGAAALAAGAYSPAAAVAAAGLVSQRQRGRALAVITAGLTVSIVTGVPLGNLVGERLGWRATFTAIAALSAIVAIGLRLLLPRIPAGEPISLRTRVAALKRTEVRVVLASTVLGILAGYLGYTYVAPISGAMGASRAALPIVLIGFGVGAAIGSTLSGVGVDRYGQTRTVRTGAVIQALALLGLTVGSLTSPKYGVAPACFGFALLGVGSWTYNAPQQHRLVELVPEDATTVVALNSSAIYAGIGLSAVLGALTISTGTALATAGAAALTSAVGSVLALVTAALVGYRPHPIGRNS